MVPLPKSLEKGIKQALEIFVQTMTNANKILEHSKDLSILSYNFTDGFVLMEYSAGVQYNLHLFVHMKGKAKPVEFVANVFLPLLGAGMTTYQKYSSLLNGTVHVIINIRATSSLESFLRMYQDVCIVKNKIKMHLHVSMLADNPKAGQQISHLAMRYPRELITVYDFSQLGLTITEGYKNVVRNIPHDDDLVILMDDKLHFTKSFIRHVLLNVVKGRQVYMPVFFSFYNPEFVSRYLKNNQTADISADTGFFLYYNYQIIGIYKSDYDKVMRTRSESAGKVIRNDIYTLVDQLLSSDLYIMRSLEPHLRRKYQPKVCTSLSGWQLKLCMSSKTDRIGNKQILTSLLIEHHVLDDYID